MHGKTACPREVPTYADAILVYSEEEWDEFALAYAYGQTVSKDAFKRISGAPEVRPPQAEQRTPADEKEMRPAGRSPAGASYRLAGSYSVAGTSRPTRRWVRDPLILGPRGTASRKCEPA